MERPPFVPLGRIVKTHGVSGELSVASLSDRPFDLLDGVEVWLVPPPDGVRTTVIEGTRPGPKGPLVKLRHVDDIGTARALVGSTIVARPDDLPGPWAEARPPDPVGLRVSDVARGDLGVVVEVIVTGANDVWVVDEGPFGEVLLPVIDDVVLSVDWEAREAGVRLLPGLLPGEE